VDGVTLMGMERVWQHRVRWRLRGAWQWPAFVVLTAVNGVLLTELPFYGDGPGGVVPGVLLAGFLNLFVVAVLAPPAGAALRRRRPDLPRIIARDYAGTVLLAAVTALFVLGGLLHRPAVADEEDDERAVVASVHDYVLARAPEYRDGLGSIDALRIVPDQYRACVPGDDPSRWLCLIVSTDQHPPGITVDADRAPNSTYRRHGGF
jgi:hypothetical protein